MEMQQLRRCLWKLLRISTFRMMMGEKLYEALKNLLLMVFFLFSDQLLWCALPNTVTWTSSSSFLLNLIAILRKLMSWVEQFSFKIQFFKLILILGRQHCPENLPRSWLPRHRVPPLRSRASPTQQINAQTNAIELEITNVLDKLAELIETREELKNGKRRHWKTSRKRGTFHIEIRRKLTATNDKTNGDELINSFLRRFKNRLWIFTTFCTYHARNTILDDLKKKDL